MRVYPHLEKIDSPSDVKALDMDAMPTLCMEIREFLIENVSKTGGHLASSLGAVEICAGIHRVFSAPKDSVVFDVGHQAYAHKILTGRREAFSSLRSFNGISGFLRPNESEYDSCISGHASNSISVALGMARAKRVKGEDSSTVCVIGDGALTGGMAYEALNDAGESGESLVVVVNDNDMSIDRSVGALAKRLSKIRIKPRYLRAKDRVKAVLRRLPCGMRLIGFASAVKYRIRTTLLKESIFEIMGFRYLGPADGNNISTVCSLLEEAKKLACPVVVHLKTVKGKGYYHSEQSPVDYHGVSAFDPVTGETGSGGKTFSSVFGEIMCRAAENDTSICAVTAAMETGTGLGGFVERFPERFFDVGIAEGHAAAMSAGLALNGMKPVCAIYSTFLQRAYDQLIHDIAMNEAHVVLAVDRAGLVGPDGQTHHGVFDVPYLLSIPKLEVWAPASFEELKTAFEEALYRREGPIAIRYPRGGEGIYTEDSFDRTAAVLKEGKDVTLASYGIMINEAIKACSLLSEKGVSVELVKLNCLTDQSWSVVLESAERTGRLAVLEDCVLHGSLGEVIAAKLCGRGANVKMLLMNIEQNFVPEGKVDELYKYCKIDADSVSERIMRNLL